MLILVVRSVRSSECPHTNLSTDCVSYTSKIYPELGLFFFTHLSYHHAPKHLHLLPVTIASSFFSFYSFCPPLVLFVPNAAISMTLLNHTAEHVSSARNPSVVFILEALAVTSTCLIISSWSSPPTFPLVHCSSHTGFFAPP